MKFYSQNTGTLFNDLEGSLLSLNKENRWIRLAQAMPWASVEVIYNKTLNNRVKGVPNKPARIVVGAMIIKQRRGDGHADPGEPIHAVLVGLAAFTSDPIFTPELLTIARHRMGEDTFNEITLILAKAGAGKVKGKGGDSKDGGLETDEVGINHKVVCKVDATMLNFSNIVFVDGKADVYPILPYTDVLITDYSSVLYDYLLMDGKGVILYLYDLEEYEAGRSFIFPFFENVTGTRVNDFDALLNCIDSHDFAMNEAERKAINDRFWGDSATYNANQKILDFIKLISKT